MNNNKKCVFTPHRNKSKNNRLQWTIKRSDRVIKHQHAWCLSNDRDHAVSEMLKEGYVVEIHPYIREEVRNG